VSLIGLGCKQAVVALLAAVLEALARQSAIFDKLLGLCWKADAVKGDFPGFGHDSVEMWGSPPYVYLAC